MRQVSSRVTVSVSRMGSRVTLFTYYRWAYLDCNRFGKIHRRIYNYKHEYIHLVNSSINEFMSADLRFAGKSIHICVCSQTVPVRLLMPLIEQLI